MKNIYGNNYAAPSGRIFIYRVFPLPKTLPLGCRMLGLRPVWLRNHFVSQGVAVGLSYYMAESLHITAQRIALGKR